MGEQSSALCKAPGHRDDAWDGRYSKKVWQGNPTACEYLCPPQFSCFIFFNVFAPGPAQSWAACLGEGPRWGWPGLLWSIGLDTCLGGPWEPAGLREWTSGNPTKYLSAVLHTLMELRMQSTFCLSPGLHMSLLKRAWGLCRARGVVRTSFLADRKPSVFGQWSSSADTQVILTLLDRRRGVNWIFSRLNLD